MLQRIVVATDGSERAQRAEQCAGRLTPPGRALEFELLYVHVELRPHGVEHRPLKPWYLNPDQLAPYVLEEAELLLRAAEARLRSAAGTDDVRVWRRFVGSDDVAGMIVHEAERASADLIVLGGRAHRGRLFLSASGVCSAVLQRSPRPVLLVP